MASSSILTGVFLILIAGTYVALTLQGPPPSTASLPLEPLPTEMAPSQRTTVSGETPPSPPLPLLSVQSSTPTQRITGPKPLQVTHIISRINITFLLDSLYLSLLCNIKYDL